MMKRTIRWISVAAAATALVGTAAFTAMASAPDEAEPNTAVDIASYEAAEDVDGSVVVAGDDGQTMTFTIEDGVIMDADGNELGTVDGDVDSTFVLTDEDGNPVQLTVSACGEAGSSTVTYTIAENIAE